MARLLNGGYPLYTCRLLTPTFAVCIYNRSAKTGVSLLTPTFAVCIYNRSAKTGVGLRETYDLEKRKENDQRNEDIAKSSSNESRAH